MKSVPRHWHRDFETFLHERCSVFESEMSTTPDPYGADRLPEGYSQEAKNRVTRELKAIPILKRLLREFRSNPERGRVPVSID